MEGVHLEGENNSRGLRSWNDAGQLKAHFNARDVPTGAYLYRLTTPKISITKIVLLLKQSHHYDLFIKTSYL